MRRTIIGLFVAAIALGTGLGSGCGTLNDPSASGSGSADPGGGGGGGVGEEEIKNLVQFTPVGPAFPMGDLIDLEFLPGQGGEALVLSKGGTVFYLLNDFSLLPETHEFDVEDGGERGLLNVVADPDYADNGFVYFYYTALGISPDLNRVERYTVEVNTGAGTFALTEPLLIIQFSKSESPNPASNHNGGSLAFDGQGNLLIGVGDGGGGGSASLVFNISQDLSLRLGKIHRVVPNRDPTPPTPSPLPTPTATPENFTLPLGQEAGGPDNVSTPEPSIFATGLRNPFSGAVGGGGELFIGDVGQDEFEEVDCLEEGGENFGWPICEGPCEDPEYIDPIHGYAHDDETFINEDPTAHILETIKFHDGVDHGDPNKSVMVLTFYQGGRYGGILDQRLIYSDFYLGWIRALQTGADGEVLEDQHIGHQAGLTSLQTHPEDGFLYGVVLGSERIFRLDPQP